MIVEQTASAVMAAFDSTDKAAMQAAIEEEVARNSNVHFEQLIHNKRKVGTSLPTHNDPSLTLTGDSTPAVAIQIVNKTEGDDSRLPTDATRNVLPDVGSGGQGSHVTMTSLETDGSPKGNPLKSPNTETELSASASLFDPSQNQPTAVESVIPGNTSLADEQNNTFPQGGTSDPPGEPPPSHVGRALPTHSSVVDSKPAPREIREFDHKKRKRGSQRTDNVPLAPSSSSSGSSLDDAPPRKTPSRDLLSHSRGTPAKTDTPQFDHSTPLRLGLDQSNNTLLGFNDSLAPIHTGSPTQIPLGQGTPTPYQSFENVSAVGPTESSPGLDITIQPDNELTLTDDHNHNDDGLGNQNVDPELSGPGTIDPPPPITVDSTQVSEGQLTRLCNLLSQVEPDVGEVITPAQRPPTGYGSDSPREEEVNNTSLIDLETEIDSLYDKYVGIPEGKTPKPPEGPNKQVTFQIPPQGKSDIMSVATNVLSSPLLQDKDAPDNLEGAVEDDGQDILAPDEKLNLPHVVEGQWKSARKGLVKANKTRARATHLRDLCTTLSGDIAPAQPPWALGLEGLPAYITEDASLVKVVVEHRRQSGFDLMQKISRELFRRAAQQTECSIVTLCQAREVAVKEGVDNFAKAVMLMARVVGLEKAKTKFQLSKRRAWYLQHQPNDKDWEHFHLFAEASFRSNKKESGDNNRKGGNRSSSVSTKKKNQKSPPGQSTPIPPRNVSGVQDFPLASPARTPQGQDRGRQGRKDQPRPAVPSNKGKETPAPPRGRKRSNSRKRVQRRSRSRSRSAPSTSGAQQQSKSARMNKNNQKSAEMPPQPPMFDQRQWMEMAKMMPPFQFPFYPMMFPPGYGTGSGMTNTTQDWRPQSTPPKKGKGKGKKNQ